MRYRPLGQTGIDVSEVSFGAGPVPALLTAPESFDTACRTIARAVELGINWFDTAATYGEGRSETNLGRVLKELGLASKPGCSESPASRSVSEQPSDKVGWAESSSPTTAVGTPGGTRGLGPPYSSASSQTSEVSEDFGSRRAVHVATKVRLFPDDLADMRSAVFRSVEASLRRLQLPAVTLLQLHNSLTSVRGAQPTSLTPEDVLGPHGILSAFAELQRAGLVQHLGLTGLGESGALIEVIRSQRFATVQAPFNVLHPSAGHDVAEDPPEHDLCGLFAVCREFGLGVFAIRVYAGGALVGLPPSAHTLTTKFFPHDLYERDRARAAALLEALPPNLSVPEVAFRFALSHPAVSSALVGCGAIADVEQAVAFAERGPLTTEQRDAWMTACGFAPVE